MCRTWDDYEDNIVNPDGVELASYIIKVRQGSTVARSTWVWSIDSDTSSLSWPQVQEIA